ncbi:hypothetical protein BD626DRAFT_473688, partial [Schizophyllum amplum]
MRVGFGGLLTLSIGLALDVFRGKIDEAFPQHLHIYICICVICPVFWLSRLSMRSGRGSIVRCAADGG